MSIADIVNDWYRQNVSGGAVAEHTRGYNQLIAARPKLIADLEAAIPAAPSASTDPATLIAEAEADLASAVTAQKKTVATASAASAPAAAKPA